MVGSAKFINKSMKKWFGLCGRLTERLSEFF